MNEQIAAFTTIGFLLVSVVLTYFNSKQLKNIKLSDYSSKQQQELIQWYKNSS